MFDDAVVLAYIVLIAFLPLWPIGYLIADRNKDLVMYEMCIANGMQWVEGSCVE